MLLPFQSTLAQCSVGVGAELVVNGHFDAGMVGFSSDVIQGAVNSGADRWELGTNANLLHPSFTGVGVPTAMFFVCNGPTVVKRAWFQTVAVNPGTNYVFAAKVCNVVNPASNFLDPILRLTINGVAVTATVNPGELPDVWVPLCATWNSGGSSSAVLAVESMSTASGGNDFGIDSITFKLELVLPSDAAPMLAGRFDPQSQTVALTLDFPAIGGHFALENSKDGIDFTAIASGEVDALTKQLSLGGTAFGCHWRAMWEDEFGAVAYSQVVAIALETTHNEVNAFPNPVAAGGNLSLQGAGAALRLTNQLGQTWITTMTGPFLATEGLPPGIYSLSGFTESGKPFSIKIVIQAAG